MKTTKKHLRTQENGYLQVLPLNTKNRKQANKIDNESKPKQHMNLAKDSELVTL